MPLRAYYEQDRETPLTITKSADELRSALESLFRRRGADDGDAALLADVLVEAELRGRDTHGLCRLDGILSSLAKGRRGRPRVAEERGPLVRVEGEDASGYAVGDFMVRAALRVAGAEGFALVAARNTRHSGMLGYYAGRLAEAGVVGVMMGHCCPLVAPWGGADPVLGTNPLAAGFPWKPHPILIDLGTSATTQGAVMNARREGRPVSEASALDVDGNLTADAGAVHALLPFGGAKGYAVAMMVQLLAGPVAGAQGVPDQHRDYGLLLLAMKPDLFAPMEHYEAQVRAIAERVKSCRKREGVDEILLPGERAYRERERRLRDGVEVDARVWEVVAG